MRRRLISNFALVGLLLLLPFVLIARAAPKLSDLLSERAVSALTQFSTAVSFATAAPAEELSESSPTDLPFAVDTVTSAAPAAKQVRRAVPSPKPKRPANLFVSAEVVLRLAESSARPRGSFVPERPERPAGLRLTGVAALGIGLEDGDILIEALGMPARSSGGLVGAIIASRAEKARFLSGKVWRRGQIFQITVEQPYLKAARE